MTPPVGDAHAALVVVALSLVALAVWEALRAREGAANAAAWDRFHAFAAERGVSGDELVALEAWARRAALADPATVLIDRTIFDRHVRDRVNDLDRIDDAAPGSEVRKQRLEDLARLRRKLGHAPAPPPAPLVSSRDLLPGVRITIRPDALSTGNPPAGRLVVAWVDEEAVELAPLDGDPAEKTFYEAAGAGRGCWAVFGRPGEATYRFRSRILGRPGVELPSLVLGHGDFLVKEERRRTPRVIHKFSVTVKTQGDPTAERALAADTIDVSWGGVGLAVLEPVARGTLLALELPLNSSADTIPVTVKVVGSSAQEGGRGHVLNTQFATVSPAARTQLQVFLGAAHRQLKAQAAASTVGAA